jgi:hypothetical protein
MLQKLPLDIIILLNDYLEIKDYLNLILLNKESRIVFSSEKIFEKLLERDFDIMYPFKIKGSFYNFELNKKFPFFLKKELKESSYKQSYIYFMKNICETFRGKGTIAYINEKGNVIVKGKRGYIFEFEKPSHSPVIKIISSKSWTVESFSTYVYVEIKVLLLDGTMKRYRHNII